MEKQCFLKKDEDLNKDENLNDEEYLEMIREMFKELVNSEAFKVFYID